MLSSYYQNKLALGCIISLVIVDDQHSQRIDDLFNKLWGAIYLFESQFSRFLPKSELSLFNKNAGQTIPISTEFKHLLLLAKKISIETDGLFNPFVLPILHKIGYRQSYVDKYTNDVQADYSKRQFATIDNIKVNGNMATIPWGTAIDFGGVGKGYLADKIALLMPKNISGYWFSIGGDITTYGTDEHGKNWQIQIEDSKNTNHTLKKWIADMPKKSYSIATSSVLSRKGTDWHHIIDTRSGLPANSDVLIATVCSNSCANADILAKLAIMLGSSAKSIEKLLSMGADSVLLQCKKSNEVYVKHFGNNIIKRVG